MSCYKCSCKWNDVYLWLRQTQSRLLPAQSNHWLPDIDIQQMFKRISEIKKFIIIQSLAKYFDTLLERTLLCWKECFFFPDYRLKTTMRVYFQTVPKLVGCHACFGRVPFDQNFRKFRFKIKWNMQEISGNSFRKLNSKKMMMQRTAKENAAYKRRICKRSDQPKVDRITNNARLILREKLNGATTW